MYIFDICCVSFYSPATRPKTKREIKKHNNESNHNNQTKETKQTQQDLNKQNKKENM